MEIFELHIKLNNMPFKVYKNGSWVNANSIRVKKDGLWQDAKQVWKKISGTWIKVFDRENFNWYVKLSTSNTWIKLTDNNTVFNITPVLAPEDTSSIYLDIKYVNDFEENYTEYYGVESSSLRTIVLSGDLAPTFELGNNEIVMNVESYGSLPTSGTFCLGVYSDEDELFRSTNYITMNII